MATIKLVPSTYYLSNSNYLSVSNASNMYDDTDSTNYATVTNSRTSTSSYYIYIRGFNFDDIPSNAIVSDFTIRVKCNYSGGYSQAMYLYDGTSTSMGSSDSISSTVATHEFTCNYSWDNVVAAGSDFGIRINCRRSSRNTTSHIYIYGAEIEVTYTLPVYHTITTSTSTGSISPSGTTSVLEGNSFMLTINASNPTVTDNDIDVTSQLERITSGTSTFIPYDSEYTGFTISNINNAYSGIDDSSYANCDAPAGGTTSHLYLDLGPIDIPSTATISSVSCQASLQISRNGSSSGMTAYCQMYSGSTAKGSATTLATSATDVARTTYTLNIGTWTAVELQNARFHVQITNNASGTHRYVYVYGVSFTVTYTVSGEVYTYTVTNVTGDHVIVVSAGASQQKIYIKVNGSWVAMSRVYKKVNGSWVEQTDLSNVFQNGVNYRKGN